MDKLEWGHQAPQPALHSKQVRLRKEYKNCTHIYTVEMGQYMK